jgi:hypothetical protein
MNHQMSNRSMVIAAAILGIVAFSGPSLAQSPTPGMSAVTTDYPLDLLQPTLSEDALARTKEAAKWWIEMGASVERRSAEIWAQLDQRIQTKKGEIEVLKSRAKTAGATNDDAAKKQLKRAVKEQELEYDILTAVKKLSEEQKAAAKQWTATGKSMEALADRSETLQASTTQVRRDHEKAVEAAAKAGLPAPTPAHDFKEHAKYLEALDTNAKALEELGKQLRKIADVRESLLEDWRRRFEAMEKN